MFKIKTAFGTYKNCVWRKVGTGFRKGEVRYEIWNEDGPIMAINSPGYGKSDTIVAVKNYSENTGIMAFLEKHGLVKKVHGYVNSGYVRMPLVELDIDKMEEMNQPRVTQVLRVLPHGSGINGDWNIRVKSGRVSCYNVYDHMDENGFYDACLDFSVVFKPDGYNVHVHHLTGAGHRFVRNDGLREYLEDTFSECYDKVALIMNW